MMTKMDMVESIAETVYEDTRVVDVTILVNGTVSVALEDDTQFIVSVEKVL